MIMWIIILTIIEIDIYRNNVNDVTSIYGYVNKNR